MIGTSQRHKEDSLSFAWEAGRERGEAESRGQQVLHLEGSTELGLENEWNFAKQKKAATGR